jgi:hypothetical protein
MVSTRLAAVPHGKVHCQCIVHQPDPARMPEAFRALKKHARGASGVARGVLQVARTPGPWTGWTRTHQPEATPGVKCVPSLRRHPASSVFLV